MGSSSSKDKNVKKFEDSVLKEDLTSESTENIVVRQYKKTHVAPYVKEIIKRRNRNAEQQDQLRGKNKVLQAEKTELERKQAENDRCKLIGLRISTKLLHSYQQQVHLTSLWII